MNDRKKSICILPWIAFNTTPQGKSRPCGYSALKSDVKISKSTIEKEFNNDLFKSIRKSFLKGEWHENCSRCKIMTEAGVKSKLDDENFMHFDENEYLIDLTNSDGSVNYYPKNIDIRLGTVCNLKCIHCGVGNSSKWNEDKSMLNNYENLETFKIDNSWVDRPNEMWNDLYKNIKHIKKFNWLGGEPFASKQHNKFMSSIPDEYAKDISIQYVTNGLLLNKNILDSLSRFKHISINVSIDVIEDKAELFRYPLKWDIFLKNLNLLKQYHYPFTPFWLKFQWTASNISMFYFKETYDFCINNYPEFEFTLCNYVDFPNHMSPQNIPLSIKQQLTEELLNYDTNNKINFYISYMNKNHLWRDNKNTFINYINDLQNVRDTSYSKFLFDWGDHNE